MDTEAVDLLKHPKLWRANQLNLQQNQLTTTPTGFDMLDQHLAGGGWPEGGLIEIMMPPKGVGAGVGELRLLIPALKALCSQQQRWVAWVNPPFIPYAPALRQLGIDTEAILLIQTKSHAEALWATERACKSGACCSTLAWLDERQLKPKDTQRLHVAAKRGGTLNCLFRPQTRQASMAEIRIAIHSLSAGELHLDILKRRAGWPISDIRLPLEKVTQSDFQRQETIEQQLQLWRSLHSNNADLLATPAEASPQVPPNLATVPLQHVH